MISIDGEYGLAMRIEQTPQYPFAISLGALKEAAEKWVEEVGYRMGLDMKKAGIHLNLAPCADVNTNPNNPVIGYRSFGTDPMKVAQLALANYNGMKRAGIGACLKHFPGHGDTEVDSHLGIPVLRKTKATLQQEELMPFQYGIDRGVDLIMVGHLAIPSLTAGKDLPASISKEIITDLLKGEMGFKGLVISDALNMKAVAKYFEEPGQLELEAFNAGNDLLCFSDHVSEGIEKITKNCMDEKIEVVFQKIISLKEKLGVLNSAQIITPKFDWDHHSILQSQLAANYIQVIHGEFDRTRIEDLSKARKLAHRSFFHSGPSIFEDRLNERLGYDLSNIPLAEAEIVLLSIFVPSHKPLNQFEMELPTLQEIHHLIQSKRCLLIHFGNPLAIKHLGKQSDFEAISCCYQKFAEVQALAAELNFD